MPIDGILSVLTLGAALGCGLMGGLFFAFSVAVMRALARLPAAQGIAAMQSINLVILNPVFLATFLGTAAACVVLIAASLLRWQEPGAGYLLVGGVLYLVGNMLVTMVFNVPLNDRLAAVAPGDPAAAGLWADYLTTWTAWNHVRTATGLAAAAALTIGLRL